MMKYAILILLIIGVTSCTVVVTATPDSEVTPLPTDTLAPTPSETPVPTQTPLPPTPTTRPTRTQRPTNTPIPTPAVDGVVLGDGTELRPGATTWWYPQETLEAATELRFLGYDENFAGWVYVVTLDGEKEGWVEVEDLWLNRELENLPHVTPQPTLTAAPVTPEPSPLPTLAEGCEGGELRLDAWPAGHHCGGGGGWSVTIFVEGHGGDCLYTYAWDGVVQGGPTSESMAFEVKIASRNTAMVGTASVTSAGQTVEVGIYLEPQCK